MVSKSEKRLARKQLKLAKTLEKTARQLIDPAIIKDPKFSDIQVSKAIPAAELKELDRFMTYLPDHHDHDGAWSWGQDRNWGEEVWNSVLNPYIQQYSQKKWGEIDSERTNSKGGRRTKRHKFYNCGTITDEARLRLAELEKDDLEEFIFRFRIKSKQRFYGFRIESVFFGMWWDPEHRICPSRKS